MTQEHLISLSLLARESTLVTDPDFNDVVEEIPGRKARNNVIGYGGLKVITLLFI